jgi:hypothetical protein
MSAATIDLHHKLYRAKAIDEAMTLVAGSAEDVRLTKTREGDHYRVCIEGIEPTEARDLLAEVADAALVITVEQDRR